MALPTLEDTFVLTLSFLSKREKPTRLTSLVNHIIEVKNLTPAEVELKYKNEPVLKSIVERAFDHLIQTPFITGQKNNFVITTKGQKFLNNNSQFIDSKLLASQSISYSNFLKNSKNKDFFQLGDSLNSFIEKENRDRESISQSERIKELRKKYFDKENERVSETNQHQQTLFPLEDVDSSSFCSNYELHLEKNLLEFLKKEDAVKVFEKVALLVAFNLVYNGRVSMDKFRTLCSLTPKGGDGGIDGNIIKENGKTMSVQAKRYADKSKIYATSIRDFLGASDKPKVVGGYFITTSDFHEDAKNAASQSKGDMNLINGVELVKHMIDYKIGIKEVPINSKLVSGKIYEIDKFFLRNIPI